MTLPDERTRSVIYTRRFLRALLCKSLWEETYPLIPWPKPHRTIRDMASRLIKHYPDEFHLKQASLGKKDVFDAPPERED